MSFWQQVFSGFVPLFRKPKPEIEERNDANPKDRILQDIRNLCWLPPAQPNQPIQELPAEKVQNVADLLQELYESKPEDPNSLCSRPRTWIILYNLDCDSLMNEFIRDEKTDIWLPYNEDSLPHYIPGNKREAFLKVQKYLLTPASELEPSSDDDPLKVLPHKHLKDSGDHHFTKISTLGQGSFGVVDKVHSRLSQKTYARKSVARRRKKGQAQTYLAKELTALKHLSHRHLVKVLGSYTDTEYIAYLMLPVAESNLEDFLRKEGGLTREDKNSVRTFFGCLAGAVDYLHRSKIRHRDLGSRNMLVHNGSVFISDFGSAYKWAGNSIQGSMTQDQHVPASLHYMAPEVVKRAPRSCSSDMWSLGIVFLEITTLLVGRTVPQLRNVLYDNNRPNIWTDPTVVLRWLERLRESNKGPAHDNEPLEWIMELLHQKPKSRPTASMLMEDIHNTQSSNIFCCINCQQEYNERRFISTDMETIREEVVEDIDTTDIMQTVASLLEEQPQPTVLSSITQSSIQTWLAKMPGGFGLDDEADDTRPERGDTRSLMNQIHHPASVDSRDTLTPLASDTLPSVGQSGSAISNHVSLSLDISLSAIPRFARDTGMGFFVLDSPSSSDNGIFVQSDSSGSDSDSDVTVMVDSLPQFTGEEEKLIQTLDALAEEPDHVADDISVQVETDVVSVKIALQDQPEVRTTMPPQTTVVIVDIPPNEKLTTISSKHYGDATVATVDVLVPEGSIISTSATELPVSVETPRIVSNSQVNKPAKAIGDVVTNHIVSATTPAHTAVLSSQPSVVEQNGPGILPAELSIKNDEIATTSNTALRMPHPEPSEVNGVPETPIESPAIRHTNLNKKRFIQTRKKRRDSLMVSEDAHGNSSSSQSGPFTPERGSLEPPKKHESKLAEPCNGDKLKPTEPSEEEKSEPAELPPWDNCNAVEASPQEETSANPTEVQQVGLEVSTKPRKNKSRSRQVTFVDDFVSSTKPPEQKQYDLELGFNPNEYIEQTWESASTVATSVMSVKTKSILKGLSLKIWLDRDHKLMEAWCSKGKALAVRALLEKGCNPGKAGSGATRRPGPINRAVQGASLKHNKCVKALIEAEVDVNVVNKKSGKTPLHLAIENRNFEGYKNLIRLLIEGGANTNHADTRGYTPILKLLHENDTGPLEDHHRMALALLLRDQATDIEVTQPVSLNTPLHLAVRRKDPYAVGMLRFKNADVNAKNAAGITPLLFAASQLRNPTTKDQVKLMSILLNWKGILVNEKAGAKEQTALHSAIDAGVAWAVEKLLEYSADPTCRDSENRNAWELAQARAEEWNPEDRDSIMLQLGKV